MRPLWARKSCDAGGRYTVSLNPAQGRERQADRPVLIVSPWELVDALPAALRDDVLAKIVTLFG